MAATIKYTELDVSPQLAKKWLDSNSDQQRPVSWARVEAFAADMRNGDWKLTHQAIAFDAKNVLIDGQHRLHAVVSSGKTIRMVIATNPEAVFSDPIDRGTPRSINQILGMSTKKQAALNTLRQLELGYYVVHPLTVALASETAMHHEEALKGMQTFTRLRGPVLGACVWAYPCAPERVKVFADRVEKGEMIKRGDPEFALRNWLGSKQQHGANLSWNVAMATLNAIRYAVANLTLNAIFVGESGYRAVTTQRRVLKIPYTPANELVQTMASTKAIAKRKVARGDVKPSPLADTSWAAVLDDDDERDGEK